MSSRRSLLVFAVLSIVGLTLWNTQPNLSAVSTTIVISEFRTRGPNGGNDEFIELLNLSSAAVDMSGWKIKGSNAAGTVDVRALIPANTSLNAGCRYLLTNSNTNGYSGAVPGNQIYGVGITDDGGIAVTRADDTIVDQVGMSSGSAFKEGTPLAPLTSNLSLSYERKPVGVSTTDTDNNDNDFQVRSPSDPQNASEACLTPPSPTSPTASGFATPSVVLAGGTTMLTVTVTPGESPASSGMTVTGNLTAIGGSSAQAFSDTGTNGDVTAGDNVFTFQATVASGTSTGGKSLPIAAADAQGRSATTSIALTVSVDSDGDGLPDAWESQFGFSTSSTTGENGAGGDPDADGVSNLTEYQSGTDPLLANVWNLPEGATGFFQERIGVVNPGAETAMFTVTFLTEDGGTVTQTYTLAAQRRLTISVNDISGLANVAVSAVVTTTRGGVVVERTMMWDARDGSNYGGHTGKAIPQARATWYLAEGEASFFDTYILLANANSSAATVTLFFLLENGNTITDTRTVPANSRVTVYANDVPGLRGNAFSTTITSNIPITVERAMYFGNAVRLFNGGHESAAVEAPATSWFVAEGRTGPFFDVYLLLANPGTVAANVTIRFLKPGGDVVTQTRTLNPTSRTTVHVDSVPGLADTDVSASITSDQPIIVERAMYWPDPFTNWYEAHNSSGVTATGTKWALAEGEIGGSLGFETYILLANPGSADATVTLTFLRTGGSNVTLTRTVTANSRLTIPATESGLASGEQFGVVIDSTQPIAVERAIYWNGGGQFWGAGTNETGVRIR